MVSSEICYLIIIEYAYYLALHRNGSQYEDMDFVCEVALARYFFLYYFNILPVQGLVDRLLNTYSVSGSQFPLRLAFAIYVDNIG